MARDQEAHQLVERFPALERLDGGGRRRQVPVVQQQAATDCGVACLTMILRLHGKHLRLADVRSAIEPGRDGASAAALIDAGERFGLRGRGLRLEPGDLADLSAGTILHWELNHFVVLERVRGRYVDLVDPAVGRRRVPMSQVTKSFTGVALEFEPGERFVPEAPRKSLVSRSLRHVLAASGDWWRIITVSAMLQLFALALPVLTGAVVDTVVPRGDVHLLAVLGLATAGLVIAHLIASIIRAHLLIHLRTMFDSRMTLGFLEHLLRLPYAFFQQRPTGDLMMRVNSNAIIREMLTSSALSTLLDGTLVVVYLLVLLVASPPFAAIVVALAVAQLGIVLLSRRRQHELVAATLRTQADAESYLVELLAGIETLKSSGSERHAGQHWSGLFVDQLNASLRRSRLNATVDSLTSTLRLAAPLVLLGYGASRALDGSLSLGTILALCALGGAFLTPLGTLVATMGQLQLLGSYLDRIEDVLDATPEEEEERPRVVHQARGRVTLERISFSYGPTLPTVVRDVSVEIAPGAFVAIVGKSGSGKSTLGHLLLGLYAPTHGRVLYDGIDVAGIDLRSLRRQLGVVNQRGALFSASIRANIAFGDPGLPFGEIVAAARAAELHDEIAAMPMGYDTLLLGGGASLSGGQRQRLALARALARRPSILLLDEATSALDTITERAVQAQLTALQCTRIVIAHRLSTVREADLIVVMDEGCVIEHGRHAELLARGGAYAHLFAAQLEH
jgi:ABC-type bacteriocin/lantibiotic exporter with double-glycine peptidase domain